MADKLNVVTGASGLLGSHIVERLAARGERVRGVVRQSGNAAFLKELRVETAVADLHDIPALRRAVAGAAIVYHCAAHVSDWGPWRQFEADTIHGTRNVLEASRAEGVGRVLHVSSSTVYGIKVVSQEVTEETPLAPVQQLWRWDYYGRSKVLAEHVAREFGQLVTMVRPTWCYGPRDRAGIQRAIDNLRRGRASIIGTGDNPLNLVHARDVAEGAILAANYAEGAGQSYNLNGPRDVTQLQYLNALSDAIGVPRLQKHVALGLAMRGALFVEFVGRLIRKATPPRFTRRALDRLNQATLFSTEKARQQLGWQPRVSFAEGIQETLAWFLRQPAG
jgi:nucleoside-diphosphate-sugar epimerase